MKNPFQIGDIVACVDASPCTHDRGRELVACPYRRGDIAKVVDVYSYGIALEPNKHMPHAFIRASRFRHLRKADDQFTMAVRACRPVKDLVPA
jgi:hypothetical protein